MSTPVLPPSAPFTSQQRAYLNGLFAGLFGLDNGDAAPPNSRPPAAVTMDDASLNRVVSDSVGNNRIVAPAASPAALNGVAPLQDQTAADESTPWHDPSLALNERMELAQNRPLPQKFMAAMAQLDCGQCGYLCRSYAEAIADGSEKSLRKCIPGGKETSNQLKELVASS